MLVTSPESMIEITTVPQAAQNAAAVAAVCPFLGGPSPTEGGWSFRFEEYLESNWGAVYGGAVAAAAVSVARCAAPDRSLRGLHLQFVRTLPRGDVFATAEVRHSGRAVTTVEVVVYDQRRKVAAIALVTMVNPDAIATEHDNAAATPFAFRTTPCEPTLDAPIVDTLSLVREENGAPVLALGENLRANVDGTPSPIITIEVPWDEVALTGPEIACLAADPCVGCSILNSSIGEEALGPNVDITLRFTTAPATRIVSASGTVLSVQTGTATVGIEVQADDRQLAQALSTALLRPADQ